MSFFSIFDQTDEDLSQHEQRDALSKLDRDACRRLDKSDGHVLAALQLPVECSLADLADAVEKHDRLIDNPPAWMDDGPAEPPVIDWTAEPEGESFSVSFGRPQFGSVVWECEVSFFSSGDKFDSRRKDASKLWERMRGESIEPVSHELGYAYDALLLAHLQRLAPSFRTPSDAEREAEKIVQVVERAALEIRREEFAPDLQLLVSQAVDSARPTPTGIDSLDAILGGGLVPGVYVVAGDPGAGKTALAVQMLLYAAHSCDEDERAAYVMLDQGGAPEIAKRLVSLAYAVRGASGYVECQNMDRCKLSNAAQWDDVERGLYPGYVDDLTNGRAVLFSLMDGSVTKMKEALVRIMREGNVSLRFLAIDYYQLLRDVGSYEPTGETVGSSTEYASLVMRELRTWATDNGVPVVLVGQFSKEAITRHAKGAEPVMTDLLGAVDVPYQAESVLMLTNAHDGTGLVTISDAKHRHAGNDAQSGRTARLRLDGEHGLFTEADQ